MRTDNHKKRNLTNVDEGQALGENARLRGSSGPKKIVVKNLRKVFEEGGSDQKQVVAIEEISFSVNKASFLCIVGPSGCGKTTLLRILAGLEEKTSGEVKLVHERPDHPLTSMVFQENSVLPWLSVRENIAYGLKMRGVPQEQRDEVVQRYVEMVGLSKFADSYPHQLSGGMKQRVSVARAFANDPEILLMDEPFASLDEQNKLLLQEELLRLWEGTGKAVVFVTHSIDEALVLSDEILVMTAHPGRKKEMIEINLPRTADVSELKGDPRFVALYTCIWDLLKEEVLKRKREEGLEMASN